MLKRISEWGMVEAALVLALLFALAVFTWRSISKGRIDPIEVATLLLTCLTIWFVISHAKRNQV